MARDIVFRIPGGWYGSDPGFSKTDPELGCAVVDGQRVADAIFWLRRRRMAILSTRVERGMNGNDGVLINYRKGGAA